MNEDMKKYVAEAFGTLVLVLFGCGSAVLGGQIMGGLGIAFAFGLVIIAMAYLIGPKSGCHINPAVSFAMFLNKRISAKEFAGYVISQVVGAIVGAALLFAILKLGGADTVMSMGENFFGDFGMWGAFLIEVILTFVFVAVVVGVTGQKGNKYMAGIIIGLTLVLVHIMGIPLTGTSVNPARSLAPAIFMGADALKEVWVFLVAPMIGGGLAAMFCKTCLDSEVEVKKGK